METRKELIYIIMMVYNKLKEDGLGDWFVGILKESMPFCDNIDDIFDTNELLVLNMTDEQAIYFLAKYKDMAKRYGVIK